MVEVSKFNRRDVLKFGLAGVISASVPTLLTSGEAYAANGGSWRVSFRHAHTGETFNGVYRVGDRYLPNAFERISYVMRDFRTQEVFPMDPHVIDILSTVQRRSGTRTMVDALSAYRSPKTNAMLRNSSTRVARNSYHMYGQAVDIRLKGFSSRGVRDIAKSLKIGGVGYYARSNFVHVDTGDVRSWQS